METDAVVREDGEETLEDDMMALEATRTALATFWQNSMLSMFHQVSSLFQTLTATVGAVLIRTLPIS